MQEKERKMSLVIDELRGQNSQHSVQAKEMALARDGASNELARAKAEIARLQQENLILQTRYSKSCEYLEKAENDVRVALNLLGVMKQNQAPVSSIKRPPPPPPQVIVEQKIDLDAIRALILAKSRRELSETVQEAEIKKAKVAELERLIAAKIDDLEVLLKV